jgi:RND family efflux transporter MFP subunit
LLKKFTLPIVIIALAILVFFLLKVSKPATPARAQPEKAWLVDSVAVKYQRLAPEVTIYGRVETPRDANLKAAIEADVIEVNVLEGITVNENDVLIQLDVTDVQLAMQQRAADVDEARALINSETQRYQRDQGLLANQKQLVNLADKAVQRAKKLESSRLASQAALDEALAAYEQQELALKQLQHDINEHPARLAQLKAALSRAQALLEQSKVNLARSEIRAPFDGRVAGLTVALGDRVRAGDSLLTIYDLNQLEVRAQIPGRYIAQVRRMLNEGQTLTASAWLDGEEKMLTLARLSGEVRQDSGGIDGLFRLKDNHEPLPLGTFVELQLQLAEQDKVIELPFSALYGMNRVYLIEDEHLRSITIERIGEKNAADGNTLLIRSEELEAGDLIATTQLPNAITGLRVEIAR